MRNVNFFQVLKLLQTECSIKREQLIFDLGESWSELMRWTLPQSSVNRHERVELSLSLPEDFRRRLCATVQAMHSLGVIDTKFKVLGNRLMTHVVKPIVSNIATSVEVQKREKTHVLIVKQKNGSEVSPTPHDVINKLQFVFEFLHQYFKEVNLNETVDGKNNMPLLFMEKLGLFVAVDVLDCVIKECLTPSLPSHSKGFSEFNKLIFLAESLQAKLVDCHLIPVDNTALLDCLNNVNKLFTNQRSQEIMRRAHKMMTSDLSRTVCICKQFLLGEPQHRKDNNGRGNPFVSGPDEAEKLKELTKPVSSKLKLPKCAIRYGLIFFVFPSFSKSYY